MRSPLVEAAGDYLSRGLAVIALTGKTPNVKLHKHGLYDALRGAPESVGDWELVYRHFTHPDTTGIGILTGEPYVVVDIDGPVGADEWQVLNGDDAYSPLVGGPLTPDRWVAMTHHGLHVWYAPPMDLLTPSGEGFVGPGGVKLGSKLDLKGIGGYVAAPPSQFEDEPGCQRFHQPCDTYVWLLAPGNDVPQEVPGRLASLLKYHAEQKARRLGAKEQRRAIPVSATFGGVTYSSVPSFDGLYESVRKAEEGNRNHMLHWAAASMAEEGANSEDFDALYVAAMDVGLEAQETQRTIKSAIRLVNG